MSAVPFDTHAMVKRLQSVGFTIEQAEVLTDFFRESATATIEGIKLALREQRNDQQDGKR